MKRFFITAIGTGIGKTFITCALTHQLREKGHLAIATKPVISGFDIEDETNDSHQLQTAQGQQLTIDVISPFRFAAPLSPNMAAAREDRMINVKQLQAVPLPSGADFHFIEGVGGLHVPLNDSEMVIDWIEQLSLPVILVASHYLGALNHTLLSIEALERRNIPIRCIIVSGTDQDDINIKETITSLSHFTHHPIIPCPRVQQPTSGTLWKFAPDMTQAVV